MGRNTTEQEIPQEIADFVTYTKEIVNGKLLFLCSETLSGASQESILGPLIFNVFIYDIFLFITNSCLKNYGDDNRWYQMVYWNIMVLPLRTLKKTTYWVE